MNLSLNPETRENTQSECRSVLIVPISKFALLANIKITPNTEPSKIRIDACIQIDGVGNLLSNSKSFDRCITETAAPTPKYRSVEIDDKL